MPVLDPADDLNHQQLHRYVQLGLVPDWVRSASDAFPEKSAAVLPLNVLADTTNKRYRCDTKAATFLSALYFHDHKSQIMPKQAVFIQNRLEKAVDQWGIRNAYDDMRTKLAALHHRDAVTLPDDAFAIVRTPSVGEKERLYPLRNAKEVRAAAQWLADNRDSAGLAFRDRHVIACKIVEKAAAFGADLGGNEEFIERQAGRGFCDVEAAAAMIRTHVKAASHAAPADVEGMYKLADTIEATPTLALDHEKLAELAVTVDLFDRVNNLVRGYGDYLKRPEDVLFGTLYHEVKQARHVCQLTTGTVYEPDQLSKLAVDDLRALFGDDFVESCTSGAMLDAEKLAEVAATLPYPDAVTFDRLMSDSGYAPVYKQSGVRIRDDRTKLAAAAAAYEPLL